jgi:hypothetical protein
VSPRNATFYFVNTTLVHAEFFGQRRRRYFCQKNISNVFFRKFSRGIIYPVVIIRAISAFFKHVARVVFYSTYKNMGGIHTGRGVASVQPEQPFGYGRSVKTLVCKAMSMNNIFAPGAHDPIASLSFNPLPKPATFAARGSMVIKIAIYAAKFTASKRTVKNGFAEPTPQFKLLHATEYNR